MNDSVVPITRIAAVAAWTVMFFLLVGTWAAVDSKWAVPLAATSVVASALAGTLQVRCWAIRVCTLVKVSAEVRVGSESVRSLR